MMYARPPPLFFLNKSCTFSRDDNDNAYDDNDDDDDDNNDDDNDDNDADDDDDDHDDDDGEWVAAATLDPFQRLPRLKLLNLPPSR